MRYLKIKNWREFQHYKDRNPPWIKLHRGLLDDYDFARLQDASKAHLMLIWLFASQNDGRIPEDAKFIQRKLSLERPPDLETLIVHGFLIPEQNDSDALADCKHDDSPRALAREEKRREELRAFSVFWTAYPRKVAKPRAARAWRKIAPANGDIERIMGGLTLAKASEQWAKEGGRYIPHPATWLNERRWEDEPPEEQERRFIA